MSAAGCIGRSLCAAALLGILGTAEASGRLDVRYELEAKLDTGLREIHGHGRVLLRNTSTEAVLQVTLALYPDLYATADPSLTWNERDLRYPRGWSEGGIDLEIEGAKLERTGPALAVAILTSPIPPGAEAVLGLRFTTRVPKKRGPFGSLDGVLCVQGGWHPVVVVEDTAVPALYAVRLEIPEKAAGPNSGAVSTPETRLPAWSMSVSTRFREVEVGQLRHKVWARPERPGQLRRLGEALDEAVLFYRQVLGRPEAPPLVAAFGYLEQRLAAPAGGYMLVSDQVYRVMTLLGVFHTRAVLDAAFETMLMRDFPELCERPWTAQFLAYGLRQRYFAEKYGLGKSLKDLIRGPLRLLPAFDELINGADFPGRQFYLHRIELEAERQEDYFSHAQPFPTGALLAERLGRLVGAEKLAHLSVDYLLRPATRPELERFLEEHCAQDFRWFFEQWLGPLRPMGFRIAQIRRRSTARGGSVEVDIERTGSRVDLVDVEVEVQGHERVQGSVLLDSTRKGFSADTPGGPGRVSLDARSEVEEDWRADNLSPPRLKLLLYNSRVNLEPKSGQLDALALLAFLRQQDYKNLLFLELFTKPTRTGVSADYARQFGAAIDPLRYPFTLRAGLGFERTHADEESGEDALSILTLRAGAQYDTSNYLSEVDQKNDSLLDLLLEAAPGGPFGETSFLQSRFTAARYQRLNGGVVAAGRLLLGLSFGELPGNRRFDLGNANGLRGFAAREVLADNVGMLSLELRSDVLRNFDFAFPWGFAFLHRLQLVSFADGALTGTGRDLIGNGELSLNAGVGVRLHGRWFGIMPSMGKIDVGFPLRGSEEGGVRVYLGLTQAF